MITIECIIPRKYHRTVMGAKGCKIQSVTAEYDVQIKIPDRDTYGKKNILKLQIIKRVKIIFHKFWKNNI